MHACNNLGLGLTFSEMDEQVYLQQEGVGWGGGGILVELLDLDLIPGTDCVCVILDA